MTPEYVVCVDTGSTFTKAAAVAVSCADTGRLLATAAVPTTVGPGLDVLTGLDDAVRHVVTEAGGEILAVSQFTLYGDTTRGNRPGFEAAALPAMPQRRSSIRSVRRTAHIG